MTAQTARNYVLGHSPAELHRLERQAAFYADFTDDLMRRAGIGPGMRVLDVGCGAGDVAFQAARLVGPSGAVLGIDRAPEAVTLATARAQAAGLGWCRFEFADIEDFRSSERFDAVIGRLVLMYVPDPAAALRRLVRNVRPGGIVAFQEMEISAARAVPDGPLVVQCKDWIVEAFRRTGTEVDMGSKLFAAFRGAGLPEPEMIGAIRVVRGADVFGHENLAGIVRAVLPAIERFGIATAAEVDIDTLAERLSKQAAEGGRICLWPPLISAWTRLPNDGASVPVGKPRTRQKE